MRRKIIQNFIVESCFIFWNNFTFKRLLYMKTKLLILLLAFTGLCKAQITIPDLNFKNALLNTLCVDTDLDGIYDSDADVNNDGQIQYSEAILVKRLKISNQSISNLTGLSSFANLKVLLCDNNLLTSLSLNTTSGVFTFLEYLDCSHNAITSLNLYPSSSTLSNLTTVNCSYNQLTAINISNNTLVSLNASNNNIATYTDTYGGSNYSLTTLDISNNQIPSFTVIYPNLVTFIYQNNPITTLTYEYFSNTGINVSNLNLLQSLTLNYNISIPSLSLSQLPSLTNLKVNNASIQADVVLADLPSLNSVNFTSATNNLTFSNNLGFTNIVYGFNTANGINIVANNFTIEGTSSIQTINISSLVVKHLSISNLPNLSSLKISDGSNLETITLFNLPQMQLLEIGNNGSTSNSNCIDLTIANFNNLNTVLIKAININNLVLNDLPNLVNFTTNGTSCNATSSSFTLSNLPLLHTAKVMDRSLSNLTINTLNSLYDLEIYSTKLGTLNLSTLPQLYTFKYSSQLTSSTIVLPMLTLQNFPNLNSVYLSRLNNAGLTLTNLPNLNSLVVTNDYPSTSYTPQTFNYAISNLPSLSYVQLDEIKTNSLIFSNVPNFSILKMRESSIGTAYSFQNLTVQDIFIDDMATLKNISFNNLPNFKNLKFTDCAQIQSLNFGNTNTSLESFYLTSSYSIPSTSIQSLNFTDFTQLNTIRASYKLTGLTMSNLPNLTYLNCSDNKLNSIVLDNFPLLNEVICNYNSPTISSSTYKFPLTLTLPSLTKLDVNYNNNKLANLDLSNCPSLTELKYILYNYQSSGTIPYINLRNGNPNLSVFVSNPIASICVDSDAEKTFLQSLNSNLSNSIFTEYCSFNPAGTFYALQGNSILDGNANGCDAMDLVFPNININVTSGSISSSYFANNLGSYNIPFIAGQYTLTPTFENPSYFNFSPAVVTVDFPSQASPFVQNFCVTPNGNHNDLEVILTPYLPARPGFDATYKLIYKNKGNQTQSGTINLTFNDAVLDFVTSNPISVNQSTNLISWVFTNLQPLETRSIDVTFNVNSPTETPAVVSGDVLNYTTEIIGVTDENQSDNVAVLNQTVVNAYDPNDKTCLEGETVTSAVIGAYVHYMIRFENTGTANAQNIVVKDLIDVSKFDISTLVPLQSSHVFYTRITATNKVEFIFENINLPFNVSQNKGYICFKIKTKPTLVLGDTFSNLVNIYFDYNHPIVTNSYVSTIQNPLSVSTYESANQVDLYPNPVKDILYFDKKEAVSKIEVYDLAGRILSSNSVIAHNIDLSFLSKGNYLVKIYFAKGTVVKKIVKE